MPPSAEIGPCGPWPRGAPRKAATRPSERTDGHSEEGQTGGRGDSGGVQHHCGSEGQARSWGWHTLVLAGEVWALCQEEAPLHPSLYLGQVWRRSALAGAVGVGLALLALVLRAVFRRQPRQQGAPFLQTPELIRERAAGEQHSQPGGMSANGPVPLVKALMDSLLLCLLSEPLEDPSPAHMQALAHRFEMVNQTLGRADVLGDDLHGGGVRRERGRGEPPRLTDNLREICTFLRQSAQWLRTLAQAQGDYGYSIRGVKQVLKQHWALLVQLHIQVTLRRKRRKAERRVCADVRKEREKEEEAIELALRNVERLSVDLSRRKDGLQLCRTHLSDTTHLLLELGGSLRSLEERGGVGAESLWTDRLLQSNTQKFEQLVQDFLSLERLTSCFHTHLEGLRMDKAGSREAQSGPKLSSSSPRTPAPPVWPPAPLPRARPKLPPPVSALALCERSAQCLTSTLYRLRCSVRGVEGQARSWGWHTLVLAGEVWALCQEEAPLHPSLYLGQVWRRSALAGAVGVGLALLALVLRAVFRRQPRQQGAPFLQTPGLVRERAAGEQHSQPGGMSANGPVPLVKALMDSLLLCLLSEPLEDPSPAHIQALAHRFEMVNQTLGRADVLGDDLHGGGVRRERGRGEPPRLTDNLREICTFLRQSAQWLRTLAQAQGDYGYSIRGVKQVLKQHWALLVQLHIQVTLRRRRRKAERRVCASVRKEREKEEEAIELALRNVERLSVDLSRRKDGLQLCRTHLSDTTHLLQELGGSLRSLEERGGVGVESVWTDRLLQSNTQKFEQLVQDFLSLERLTSCFHTHLEGLRMDKAGSREAQCGPKLSSSSPRTPAPPVWPPAHLPRARPKLPPPVSALALCERSAQCLTSTLHRLRCSVRGV